jgi:SAM-dependent methyltransferase
MEKNGMIRHIAFAAALSLAATQVFSQAQPAAQEYKPEVGQAGKDVVWVPTPEALVERMLRMAKVTKNDYVMDLGSGDGRIAIAAGKLGARATGVEFNPDMVALSNRNAKEAGVTDRVNFLNADIFATDFSKATVITMYLLPHLNLQLKPKILDLKPGTRIVSHAFNMDDWKPDETATLEYRDAYLWIVPAKVNGGWKMSQAMGSGTEEIELALNQKYQRFDGKARIGGREFEVVDGKLSGDAVTFGFTDGNGTRRTFSGKVTGNRMEGTTASQGGAPVKWTAARS